MKQSPLVSIIIANWNGGEIFKTCLNSLNKLNYPNWELILVDNGSSDGSENFIVHYRQIKHYKLIRNKTNLGFAQANNQGYEISSGKYILLLNNDTKVEPDFLTKLICKIEQDSQIGVIQPKIALIDKLSYLDNVGAYLTLTGFLEHWGFMEKDGPEFSKEREIFSAKGACMLIRKKVINETGLFDRDFVSYMEETDFCWRVWLAGYKVVFYPKAKIYHKVGFSSKKQNQIFVNFHSFKNRLISLIKNLEVRNLLLIGSVHVFLILLLSFYYLFKFQFNKTGMIWSAIFWNIKNFPITFQKRQRIQEIRKKSDGQIFPRILHKTNWSSMFSHFVKVEANFQ